MLVACFLLLAFQLAGEALARVSHVPIPGPVLGMGLMLIAMLWQPRLHTRVQQTSHGLLGSMVLFFAPAGVGAMTVWDLLRDNAAAFAAVVVASTLVAGWVAAMTFTWAHKHIGRGR